MVEPSPTSPAAAAANPAPHGVSSFLVAFGVALTVLVTLEIFHRDSTIQDKLVKSEHSYIRVKAAEYAKVGGDIVVTGDSRMFHAVIPSMMHQTLHELTGRDYAMYNYGIPSGTTPIFLMAAYEAAHHKKPPRVFVLGVTPALFSCCDTVSTVATSAGVTLGMVPSLVRASFWYLPEEAGASVMYGFSRLAATRTEVLMMYSSPPALAPLTFQDLGWVSLGGRVDAATQDTRARGRAKAYAGLMDKSTGAKLHGAPGAYVREAIRLLKSAGVKVVVIGTPQARQLDWYHDSAHTYFEYLDEVKRVTSEQGVPFVDCNAPPGIESIDFKDGDHLSEPGGMKFTKYLATEVIAPLLR